MSEPREQSNEELAEAVLGIADYSKLVGHDAAEAHLREAARRLAALPRIYDVQKGERPEDLSTVIAIGPGDVLSSESTYLADTDTIDSGYYDDCKGHRERVAGFQFMVDVDDLATWVKGVKG